MTLMQDMLRETDPLPAYAEVPATGAVVVEDGEYVAPIVESHTQWAACWCEDSRHRTDREPWQDGPIDEPLPSGAHWALITWNATLGQVAA